MVALNYARDVRIGDKPARAVALGSNFVWPTLPERLFLRGQSMVYDFVGQKYAARLPDAIIDYTSNVNDLGILTRASTATYWGPSGTLLEAAVDEARIQHDPVTGKAMGLLIESNRTSAFPYSCDPETWNFNRGVVLEQGHPSPIPGYTSTRVSYDGEFTSRYVGSSQWHVHGLNSAAVIYRPINGSSVFVGQMGTNSRRSTTAVVHSDGSVGYRGTSIDYLSVKPLPDGFLEVRFTLNTTGITGGWVIGIGLVEETDSFDLAYFQNEQEVTPPSISHLITDGTDVTRAADNVVIDLADVLNPDEGTFFFEFTAYVGGGSHQYVNLNNSFRLFETVSSGHIQINWGEGFSTVRTGVSSGYYSFKLALAYTGQQAQLAILFDGEVSSRSTEANFRVDNTLYLFNRPQGNRPSDGIFKAVEYYPEAATEERLIQMVGGGS